MGSTTSKATKRACEGSEVLIGPSKCTRLDLGASPTGKGTINMPGEACSDGFVSHDEIIYEAIATTDFTGQLCGQSGDASDDHIQPVPVRLNESWRSMKAPASQTTIAKATTARKTLLRDTEMTHPEPQSISQNAIRTLSTNSTKAKPEGSDLTTAGASEIMTTGRHAPIPVDHIFSTVPQPMGSTLTVTDVKEACMALKKKLNREKGDRRQNGRRLKLEPFKLSDSQLMLLAYRYRSALIEKRAVDYKSLTNSRHFPTFKGHVEVLKDKEPMLVGLLQSALKEQWELEAGARFVTSHSWEEKCKRCQAQQCQEIVTFKTELKALQTRLERETSLSCYLLNQLTTAHKMNRRTKSTKAKRHSKSQLQAGRHANN